MTLELITPPLEPALSLEVAKAHLRVEGSEEDGEIEAYIDAATRRLDGRDGYLGRCLIAQEWRLFLDRFQPVITLPLPPVMSIERITYIDAAGDEQTLGSQRYRVSGLKSLAGARIHPANAWPATAAISEAVMIDFKAGFGSDSADLPAPILQAIKLHVAAMYQHREAVTIGSGFMTETPMGWSDLVEDYRVRAF